MTDLINTYHKACQESGYSEDPLQRQAITSLQRIIDEVSSVSRLKQSIWHRLFRRIVNSEQQRVKGLYLWGGTGRGKTWLMHLFYQSLPIKEKMTIHFHAFMTEVHEKLSLMGKQKNPLCKLAAEYAQKTRVICLDEFIVTNITDAMILYGLLDSLYFHGVVIIMTSNRVPDDLYKNGLQRERFLPAINLIKENSTQIEINGADDYRLKLLDAADVMYVPEDEQTEKQMLARFEQLATGKGVAKKALVINHRQIMSIRCADDTVWFDFSVICGEQRAAHDYMEIAKTFHTVFISSIPVLFSEQDAYARRFMYLIDALYSYHVKLIFSAQAKPAELYRGVLVAFGFKRTASRLIEMQSHRYFEIEHQLDKPRFLS